MFADIMHFWAELRGVKRVTVRGNITVLCGTFKFDNFYFNYDIEANQVNFFSVFSLLTCIPGEHCSVPPMWTWSQWFHYMQDTINTSPLLLKRWRGQSSAGIVLPFNEMMTFHISNVSSNVKLPQRNIHNCGTAFLLKNLIFCRSEICNKMIEIVLV